MTATTFFKGILLTRVMTEVSLGEWSHPIEAQSMKCSLKSVKKVWPHHGGGPRNDRIWKRCCLQEHISSSAVGSYSTTFLKHFPCVDGGGSGINSENNPKERFRGYVK